MAAHQSKANEPVYFWRESDPRRGWLSQWYFCPFRDDKDPERVYDTAEHYMMYQKAILFNDTKTAAEILTAGNHPRKIKALGRQVANFSDSEWQAKRYEIVRKGNHLKFTNAVTEEGFCMGTSGSKTVKLPPLECSLRDLLLGTGERLLVEASPYDRIWGIGYTEADAESHRGEWGLNLLGKALVDVRKTLREEGMAQKD